MLADGLLTGKLTGEPIVGAPQRQAPRMQGENLRHNVETAAFLKKMGADKGRSQAQLAVAWLLSRGDDIVPLVGMSSPARLPENLELLDISFSAAELAALGQSFGPGAITGDRYPAMVEKFVAK